MSDEPAEPAARLAGEPAERSRDGEQAAVRDRILTVFVEVLGLREPPTLALSLEDDLGLGSMDAMSLVLTLEDEFGESIADEDFERLTTVGDVVALVESRVLRVPDA